MSQVGRADSKMTLDVYAQLEQRADRTTSFDALLRRAGRQRGDVDWATARQKSNSTHHQDQRKRAAESGALQAHLEWRDPDSNRGHHDFRRVLHRTSRAVSRISACAGTGDRIGAKQ
jgi:hypothetical protein